jgi:hypothetical protein
VSTHSPLETTLISVLEGLGAAKSACPTDVARAFTEGDPDPQAWRRQLSAVRRAAVRLAEAGRIEILRKGKPVPPGEVRGVIRLRIVPA